MPVSTIIKVISLPGSTRRPQFKTAAEESGVSWRFVDGYTSLAAPLKYDARKAIRHFGRELTSGEIGCYTSHYKAWEEFLLSDSEQLIVLEDDVVVDWGALARLAAHGFARKDIHILRMFCTHTFPHDVCIPRFLSPHSHLLRVRGLILGIQAYLLTRKGAQAFLSTGNSVFMPVDWVMSRYWHYGLANYCLFPFPVLERYGVSAIGDLQRETMAHVRPSDRARRLFFRIKDRMAREVFNRRILRTRPFGRIADIGPAFIDRKD